MSMKKLIPLLLFIHMPALAGEKTVRTEGDHHVAIGESENPSDQLAKQDACNAARRELIGFVFGTAYQINQNMVRSIGILDYAQDVSSNSGEIVIRGAISETEKIGETTKCTMSYPIQEANLEKERLKSANTKTIRFTDIGDTNSIKGGILEVVTVPSEVEVLIDNQRWGVTPLRLYGKLSLGTHLIRLDHPNYTVIEENIEIGATAKTRIDKILRRATGKLSITTNPIGAKVKINGQEIGYSPKSNLEIPAGQNLKIEFEHPEAEAYSQSIHLSRDEGKILDINIPLKPSFVSLNTNPPDSAITIDGSKVAPNQWIPVNAGKHDIIVERSGFESKKITFDVHGGERKAIPSIILTTLSEAEKQRRQTAYDLQMEEARQKLEDKKAMDELKRKWQLEEEYLSNPNWRFLVGMSFGGNSTTRKQLDGGSSCCSGWELGLERKLFETLSLKISLARITNGSSTDNGLSYTTASVGRIDSQFSIPFYFDRTFFIAPNVGSSSGAYSFYSDNLHNTISSYSNKQNFYGATIGIAGTISNNEIRSPESSNDKNGRQSSWGGYVTLDYKKFQNDGLIQGNQNYQLSFGLLWGL